MSSKKLSPRQKMISMMYLVLTALLAMNVSKEVLNAFVVVKEGIENSNILVNSKNIQFYSQFHKFALNADSLDKYELSALVLETQQNTKDAIDYINTLRKELMEVSGVETDEEGKVFFAQLDDTETGTRILTIPNENSNSKGNYYVKNCKNFILNILKL